MKKCLLGIFAALFVFGGSANSTSIQYVTIGTGSVTGLYYPTGLAIAKMVNKKRDHYNLQATVESTGGSVFNVNAIMTGDLEFGIVQSDRQYQAFNGTADWLGNPQKKLRTLFSVHLESANIVATVDSGIKRVADLKGKSVNIGNQGSGHRGNALDLLDVAGLDYKTDLKVKGIKPDASVNMLQDQRIDAFFYTVGHPNALITQAIAGSRKVRFIAIEKDLVDKLVAKFPYYTPSLIPVAAYPGVTNQKDVTTFGVKATFVTSVDVPEDVVYAITKEVFENIEEFKKLHPAYNTLTKEGMSQGMSAPFHPGAIKYYKEAGLM